MIALLLVSASMLAGGNQRLSIVQAFAIHSLLSGVPGVRRGHVGVVVEARPRGYALNCDCERRIETSAQTGPTVLTVHAVCFRQFRRTLLHYPVTPYISE